MFMLHFVSYYKYTCKKMDFATVDFSRLLVCLFGGLLVTKMKRNLVLQFVVGSGIFCPKLTGLSLHCTL